MTCISSEAKPLNNKRWTLARWGQEDCILDNGVISAITLAEMCYYLNEYERLKAELKLAQDKLKKRKK